MDYNEAWQTDAFSVQKILVDAAWVCTNTLLEHFVIIVALFAFSADSVDGVEASSTITVTSSGVEYFIYATSITFWLVAVLQLYSRTAVDAVLRVGVDCEEEQQEECFTHGGLTK